MKNFETIKTTAQAISVEHENITEAYNNIEADMIKTFGESILGAEVISSSYGTGKIESYRGETLDKMFVNIQFENEIKCFSVSHMVTIARFTKFVDSAINDNYNELLTIHNELTTKKQTAEKLARQAAKEAAEKAEAEKKAEAKYKQQKEKAIRDFDRLANRANQLSEVDDFYYSLGWLANHVGSISAQLPDYLGPSFERCFGADAPKTLIDSKAKSIGGFAKKWSWEFKCSLKKLKGATIPAYLSSITSDISKGIHNTSFVWDLVDNYGFQFGKKQDTEKIKQTIPAEFISSFEAGLTA